MITWPKLYTTSWRLTREPQGSKDHESGHDVNGEVSVEGQYTGFTNEILTRQERCGGAGVILDG